MSETQYWVGFSLIPGVGVKRIRALLDAFGALKEAWRASASELQRANIGANAIDRIVKQRSGIDLDYEMGRIHAHDLAVLTIQDPRYPRMLLEIDAPPPILYVRGTLVRSDEKAISVVGTRNPTKYGREVATFLAKELAQQDFTIISGMALGIDRSAHNGAIDGNGRTIGVLGCGLDIIYPRENEDLASRIVDTGALISEFPLGSQPVAANFPRRNRIVSGLALGTLVIEAPENSGALITAGHAADQGRDVFATPSHIFNRAGIGSNRLIQDGAKLVTCANDILEELEIAQHNFHIHERAEQFTPSNATEGAVLDYLGADPIHIDDLADNCNLSIAEISGILTILELKGVAQLNSRMQYSRVYRKNNN